VEAIRALKRRLSVIVYRQLVADQKRLRPDMRKTDGAGQTGTATGSSVGEYTQYRRFGEVTFRARQREGCARNHRWPRLLRAPLPTPVADARSQRRASAAVKRGLLDGREDRRAIDRRECDALEPEGGQSRTRRGGRARLVEAGRATDVASQNLTGSRFEDLYLTDARFHDVDLTKAGLLLSIWRGVTICDAALLNVDISGQVRSLLINGEDVALRVEAELTSRLSGAWRCGRPMPTGSAKHGTSSSGRRSGPSGERDGPELLHEGSMGSGPSSKALRQLVVATDV